MSACRILLADGHAVVRRGLRSLFATQKDWEVVGEAHSSEQTVRMAADLKPDVVIMDTPLAVEQVLVAVKSILTTEPDIAIMFFTMRDDEGMLRMATEVGVRGYVLKSDSEEVVIECVKKVCDGGVYFSPSIAMEIQGSPDLRNGEIPFSEGLSSLTSRQVEVLRLLAKGKTNKEVAEALGISVRTVEAHRRQLMERLGVSTVSELVILALRYELIEV